MPTAVGGGVGALVLLLSVIAAVVLLRRRRRRGQHESQARTGLRSGAGVDGAAAQPSQASQRTKQAASIKGTALRSQGQVGTWEAVPQSAQLTVTSGGASSADPAGSRASDSTPSRTAGGMMTGTWSMSTATANTLSKTDARAQLVAALEHISREHPPPVFAGRYVLLQERVSGGQAVVNFARGRDGGYFQYAIKFASMLLLAFCLRIITGKRLRHAGPRSPSSGAAWRRCHSGLLKQASMSGQRVHSRNLSPSSCTLVQVLLGPSRV